jgi:hypothetical protein
MKLGPACQLEASERIRAMNFVIRSSIDLGSSMNVGSVTLLRSAPGRSCDIMWESTVGTGAYQRLHCTG